MICVRNIQSMVPTATVVTDAPSFCHGDTAKSPRPVPPVTRVAINAAAITAPAITAPHDTADRVDSSNTRADWPGAEKFSVVYMTCPFYDGHTACAYRNIASKIMIG